MVRECCSASAGVDFVAAGGGVELLVQEITCLCAVAVERDVAVLVLELVGVAVAVSYVDADDRSGGGRVREGSAVL